MKLNQTTNLRVEDYPDQAQWIGRLFSVLNPFIRSVQQIFDSNVDFTTNIRSISKSFDTTSLTFPINFAWPFTEVVPSSLEVLSATKGAGAIALVPAWTFDASKNQVSISYLTELSSGGVSAVTSGSRYKFTVRVTV